MALRDAQTCQLGVEKRGVRVGGPATDLEGLVVQGCVWVGGGGKCKWGAWGVFQRERRDLWLRGGNIGPR